MVGALLVSWLIWLTWPVGLASVLMLVVFGCISRLKTWTEPNASSSNLRTWLNATLTGLRDVSMNVMFGLVALTLIQFSVNVCVWLFGDGAVFEHEASAWLWESEARTRALRSGLTEALRFRITLPLLLATLFASAAYPEWKPIKRVFAARK